MSGRAVTFLSLTVCAALVLMLLVTKTYDAGRWSMYLRYRKDIVPIEFYGKVVDQEGQPVAGATVVVSINTVNHSFIFGRTNEPLREYRLERVTGQDGLFTIEHTSGRTLRVEAVFNQGHVPNPEKNWYTRGEFSDNWFYYYAPSFDRGLVYNADVDNPAIFPLRRAGENSTSRPSRGGTQITTRRATAPATALPTAW